MLIPPELRDESAREGATYAVIIQPVGVDCDTDFATVALPMLLLVSAAVTLAILLLVSAAVALAVLLLASTLER